MRIKKSLTDIYDIYDYVSSFLEALGYESIEQSSSLSDSKYIEIVNADEILKKDIDNIKIRISNHDLPPTYFVRNPYDYDLKSYKDKRNGTEGDAQPYGEFLEWIYEITPKVEKPSKEKIKIPKWFSDYDKIWSLYKELESLLKFPFFEWKYLSKSERKKRLELTIKSLKNDGLTDDEIDDLGFLINLYSNKDDYEFYKKYIENNY